ncbi:MAG: CBS domain-containing protein [Myxococcota bacterium]
MTATLKIRERMSALTHTVGRDQTMSEAAHRMHEFSIRHLAVLHGGTMIGIVSDRDIALVESLPGVDASVVQVHEAMTPDPYSVTVDAPLAGVVQTMADHKYGAALVVDKGDLVGIFTTTDALRLAHDLLAEAGAPAA